MNVVQYLCGLPPHRGVNPSGCNNLAIVKAASRGHVDVVRYLCELPPQRGVNPSTANNRAIKHAASNGHLEVVKYLCDLPLNRGVDPSTCVVTCAASKGKLDVVRYLCDLPLNRGVDPSADHNSAIQEAARFGRLDVVRYLRDLPPHRGVEPSACSIVTQAAPSRHQLRVVRYLSTWPAMQSSFSAMHMEKFHNHFPSIVARRMARLPVLALCALGMRVAIGAHGGGRDAVEAVVGDTAALPAV